MPNLICKNISVQYGAVVALSDVSLELRPGSLVGLIGPNGSGKTTLLNVVAGLVRPTKGSVSLGGSLRNRPRDALARMGIFRSFQSANLFEGFTGEENVRAAYPSNTSESLRAGLFFSEAESQLVARQRAINEALDDVSAEKERRHPANEMSYGMRKRTIVAQSVVANPTICLLDEPLAGTDPQTRLQVLQAMKRHKNGHTITIWVEHDVEAIASLADRVIVLDRGTVIADGISSEVIESQAVRNIYIQPT